MAKFSLLSDISHSRPSVPPRNPSGGGWGVKLKHGGPGAQDLDLDHLLRLIVVLSDFGLHNIVSLDASHFFQIAHGRT